MVLRKIVIGSTYKADTIAFLDSSKHSFIWPNSFANFKYVSFQVIALDSVQNSLGITPWHTTNYLTTQFDACTGKIYLSWSGYVGWGDHLVSYAIYGKEGGNGWELLDSVSPSTLADTLMQVIPNETYCFMVRAWHDSGWVSSSNRTCIRASMPEPPAYISVDEASVTKDNRINLQFALDNTSPLHQYVLLRGSSPDICSDTVKLWENYTDAVLSYTDIPDDSLVSPLYYRLAALNACGRGVKVSAPATVIIPQGFHENFNIYLSWNPCLSYDTLERYTIYRQTGNSSEESVADLSPDDTSWTDNIESLQYMSGNTGMYCYRIEAIGRNYAPGTEQHSFSSIRCISAGQQVYFPNAFTPNQDGRNDWFVPVFSFAPEKYHLIIRNRMGTIVFESYNYLQAWNGKDKKENPVSRGVYNYYMYAETPQGKVIKKRGYVTVIYP